MREGFWRLFESRVLEQHPRAELSARRAGARRESGRRGGWVQGLSDILARVRATGHSLRQVKVAARKAAERDAFRVKLSDALRPLDDAPEIQAEAARVLGQHLRVNRVIYAEIEGDDFIVQRDYSNGVSPMTGRFRLYDFGPRIIEALRKGQVLVASDVATFPGLTDEERATYAGVEIAACVSTVLVKSGRWVAGIGVHSAKPRNWTSDEIALVEEVAERTWAAVERARAEGNLRRARDELELRVIERTAELSLALEQLWTEIRERERSERKRTELLRKLATAQEDERRRVARDLHDQTSQLLAELTLAISAMDVHRRLSPDLASRVAEIEKIAEELGRQVHGLAVRLRPTALDDVGLVAAVQQLLSDWSGRTQVPVDFEASGLGGDRLPPEVETVLYRVIQEALTNVAKHARANMVSVVISRDDRTAVAIIEDDGCGFDLSLAGAGRLGIVGMRERVALAGGELELESRKGGGTTVIARIPLASEALGD